MAIVLYTTRDDGYARVVVDGTNQVAKDELHTEEQANNVIGIGNHRFTRQFMEEAVFNQIRGKQSPLDLVAENDQRHFASHVLDFSLEEQRGLNGSNPERTTHLRALATATRHHITMPDRVSFANIVEIVQRYLPAEGLPAHRRERR